MQDVPKKYRPAVERLLQMLRRDASLSLRRGHRAEGPVSGAEHGGGAHPSEAEVAVSGGSRGPLPGRREPAADGLSGTSAAATAAPPGWSSKNSLS